MFLFWIKARSRQRQMVRNLWIISNILDIFSLIKQLISEIEDLNIKEFSYIVAPWIENNCSDNDLTKRTCNPSFLS